MLIGAFAIVAAIVLAYLPALRGGFVWDDDSILTNNPLIKAPDGLRRIWLTNQGVDYWPLTSTTFWVEWRLWGLNAEGYHVTNVVLHVLGTFALWAVLDRLGIKGAFLAALLFAVHPVNVESVAWITQRKNVLALVFYLLSIWFYLGFIRGGATRPRDASLGSNWRRGDASPHLSCILSLLCFTLGMLSKGSIALLPVILLGIVAWHRPIRLKDLVATLPFFTVAAALVLTDVWFQKHGAHEIFRSADFVERLLGAGAVVWFYLGKALLPIHLAFIYPQWPIDGADPRWWLPLLAAAGLTALLLRYRNGRAKPALFAWGYFCVSLVPVMGFTDVQFMQYSLVADHYGQLALIGVVTLAAGEISDFGIRNSKFIFHFLLPAFSFLILCALGALTFRQCKVYRDAETLYRAAIRLNADAWMAHNNLGILLNAKGRPEEALLQFKDAVRLKPDWAEAHFNLGVGLQLTGRKPEAMEQYEQALRLEPRLRNARLALAGLLADAGRVPESIVQDRLAFGWSDTPAIHCELGDALAIEGRKADAAAEYRQALQLDPGFTPARAGLKRLASGRDGTY